MTHSIEAKIKIKSTPNDNAVHEDNGINQRLDALILLYSSLNKTFKFCTIKKTNTFDASIVFDIN